jgi:hypothetical protein
VPSQLWIGGWTGLTARLVWPRMAGGGAPAPPRRRRASVARTAWQIVWLARSFGGDLDQVAAYLEIPADHVNAAMSYADANRQEIETGLAEQEATLHDLQRLIPGLNIVEVG